MVELSRVLHLTDSDHPNMLTRVQVPLTLDVDFGVLDEGHVIYGTDANASQA